MKKVLLIVAQVLIIAGLLTSCEKEEGEGGEGSIVGRVYKIFDDGDIYKAASLLDANSDKVSVLKIIFTENNKALSKLYGKSQLSEQVRDSLNQKVDYYSRNLNSLFYFGKDTVAACDEDVFIIYGNHEFGSDDKTNTSFNGTYKFNYLNDGDYKIYVLSDGLIDKEAIVYDVKVNGGQTYGGDFYILDGKNSGRCGVVGYLEAWAKDATGYLPGIDTRVFIREVDGVTSEDCRVDDNGYYYYGKLKPNTEYVVYSVTEPNKNEGLYPVVKHFKTGDVGTIVAGPILQTDVN